MGEPRGVSLYLHVPFCASKCAYCDFTSVVADPRAPVPPETLHYVASRLPEGADLGDAYVAALLAYLEEFVAEGVLADVPTIYVGGGTPTILGKRLVGLIEALRALPGVRGDAEVTLEANPDSLDAKLIEALLSVGVTRISLGVQSFDDDVLRLLGRRHDAGLAQGVAELLAESGARFSVDLMCGIPGQSLESWVETVSRAIETGAGHVSVYPLSIEEGTPMAARVERGELADPDPDEAATQMSAAAELMDAAGLVRYETASYSRPGEECVHNIRYWTGAPYLGVGPGAASMLSVALAKRTPLGARAVYSWPDDWRVRFTWHDSTEGFLACLWDCQPVGLEALTAEEASREDAMLGMRLAAGITDALAREAGVDDRLSPLAAQGLVEHVGGRWRTTHRGWLLGNEVFGAIWAGE